MKSIDRYMARLIAVPLFSTLIIAAMLLILDRIRRLFDFVATEGGPVSVVWRMLANLLPEYLGLGIPIGLMLGVLLAFRRLAANSELDVLRGVGMSYNRLLRVPFYYAIVLAALAADKGKGTDGPSKSKASSGKVRISPLSPPGLPWSAQSNSGW